MSLSRSLRNALDLLTRPPVLTAVAGLQIVLLLVVIAAHMATLRPPGDGHSLETGDFLAFWTGATILDSGRGADLYDFAFQREFQAEMVGGTPDGFQPYLNPPLLAALVRATVPLGYVGSFLLFGAISGAVFVAGMSSLTRALPPLARHRWTTIAVVAGFLPVLQTMLGGQNTAITLSLMAGLFVATRRGAWPVAALLLGLLTYKPQYAIGLGLALLLLGEIRVVAGGVLVGVLHWALGALVCGPEWPLRMLEAMGEHAQLEIAENGHAHFSWVRAADHVLPAPIGGVVGAAGALAVWAVVAAAAREARGRLTPAYWALAICASMLASPHLQFYDIGLIVVPAVLLVSSRLDREGGVPLGARLALACAYIGYPAHQLSPTLGFQPLVLVLLAVFVWAAAEARAPALQRAEAA